MQPDHVNRIRHIRRLYELLWQKIRAAVPAEVFNSPQALERVTFADHRLTRVSYRYEDGTASREEVLEAAEALREAWLDAAAEHGTARGPEGERAA
jgi:hypothetical protein